MARTVGHSPAGGALTAAIEPCPFVGNATGVRNIISQFSCTWTGPHLSSGPFTEIFSDQSQTSENGHHHRRGIMTGRAS